MIHRIKTVTWEVRSHRQMTVISSEGRIVKTEWAMYNINMEPRKAKATLKKTVWHLQDVLKCMRRIEKERQDREERDKCIQDPNLEQ